MRSNHHGLSAETSEAELLALVEELNRDADVDGILVQLPVPEQIDPDRIVAAIDPGKDVDGLTPVNAGLLAHGMPGLVPCTPAGVMELLDHEGVELEGAEAVEVVRKMTGETEPKSAAPGTIRGDYAHVNYGHAASVGLGVPNIIHASATREEADKEIAHWFKSEELHNYEATHEKFTQPKKAG